MTRLFAKVVFLITLLSLTSCALNQDEPTQIRLVDADGNYHAVKTRVPESNAAILASQGKLRKEEDNFKNNERSDVSLNGDGEKKITKNKYSGTEDAKKDAAKDKNENFGKSSPQLVEETFRPKQKNDQQPENPQQVSAEPFNGEVGYDSGEAALAQPAIKPEVVKPELKPVATGRKEKATALVVPTNKVKIRGVFVQAGSFLNRKNAEQSLEQMRKRHKSGVVEEAIANDKKVYRVLVGPFSNKDKAQRVVTEVKASGKDAIVVNR